MLLVIIVAVFYCHVKDTERTPNKGLIRSTFGRNTASQRYTYNRKNAFAMNIRLHFLQPSKLLYKC